MSRITLQGTPFETVGELPAVNTEAPPVVLTKNDLSDVKLSDYLGKQVIISVFPSVDTGTCATSVRTFNQKAAEIKNTVVLCVSADLPFAQSRFCGAEGIDAVELLSSFRSDFGVKLGLSFKDGPMKGLLSRNIIILDEKGIVKYVQQVPEVSDEPDYASALEALSS